MKKDNFLRIKFSSIGHVYSGPKESYIYDLFCKSREEIDSIEIYDLNLSMSRLEQLRQILERLDKFNKKPKIVRLIFSPIDKNILRGGFDEEKYDYEYESSISLSFPMFPFRVEVILDNLSLDFLEILPSNNPYIKYKLQNKCNIKLVVYNVIFDNDLCVIDSSIHNFMVHKGIQNNSGKITFTDNSQIAKINVSGVVFDKVLTFSNVKFKEIPIFPECKFSSGIIFSNCDYEYTRDLESAKKFQNLATLCMQHGSLYEAYEFHAKELNCKAPHELWYYRPFYFFYNLVSGYGLSYVRPLVMLFISFLMFYIIYLFSDFGCVENLAGAQNLIVDLCKNNQATSTITWRAALLSLDKSFTILALIFNDDYIYPKSYVTKYAIKLQYLLSTMLWYFFAVAIRRRLKLNN